MLYTYFNDNINYKFLDIYIYIYIYYQNKTFHIYIKKSL